MDDKWRMMNEEVLVDGWWMMDDEWPMTNDAREDDWWTLVRLENVNSEGLLENIRFEFILNNISELQI